MLNNLKETQEELNSFLKQSLVNNNK